MIDSRTLLKQYILLRLSKNGGVIGGDDIECLLENFELTEETVSKTQFRKALRSLEYNDRKINTIRSYSYYGGREGVADYPVRGYVIKLRKA